MDAIWAEKDELHLLRAAWTELQKGLQVQIHVGEEQRLNQVDPAKATIVH